MFTGLIEEVGDIRVVDATAAGSRVVVGAQIVLADAGLGDSIAIDGVCTTVVALDEASFTIEASPETLSKTTLKYLQPGRKVNLERPLTPNARIGGHFVTGHVDGTASVLAKFQEGNSWIYRFKLDQPELALYFIEKGSVAVNGISLTVNTIQGDVFSVAIIPHTLTHTNLDAFAPGIEASEDTVNIETDMLGKYVQRMLAVGNPAAEMLRSTPKDNSKPYGSKINSGLWFCHDEMIHGEYDSLVAHWPERPQ